MSTFGYVLTRKMSYAQNAPSDTPLYMKPFDVFQTKTLEQKIQELADREEIRELIAAYALRVAHAAPFTDLFTDDGRYITVASPGATPHEVRGRKALDTHFQALGTARQNKDTPLPMIHNYLIRISGDQGTGECSNELRISDRGKSMIASGYYEDRYQRVNGRWKFAERKITWYHWVELQQGWAKQAAE